MTDPKSEGTAVAVIKLIMGLAVAGVVVWAIVKYQDSAPSAPAAPETHEQSMTKTAVGGAMLLRQSMRDPASFEVVNVLLMPADQVCYQYRARNGFGGMNVELALFDGKTIRTESMAGFTGPYNRICGGKVGSDITGEVARMLAVIPIG